MESCTGRATGTILLATEEDEYREYMLIDGEGNVFYEDDELERGWTDAFEADQEARAWESRGEGEFFVREKQTTVYDQ